MTDTNNIAQERETKRQSTAKNTCTFINYIHHSYITIKIDYMWGIM